MAFGLLTPSQVWAKATIVPGYDSRIMRKDACGAWIKADAYGNRNSDYGWEIDHIVPVISGGSDALGNLQPLHWKNNARKGDGALVCAISAR